ncbi:hypothetical protein BC943DRAFT_314713 [Umbelopsis sp. AD052]|nr:hypothetical protein BC943DRAFT_314713 [Umbelopsis sp. AD052]
MSISLLVYIYRLSTLVFSLSFCDLSIYCNTWNYKKQKNTLRQGYYHYSSLAPQPKPNPPSLTPCTPFRLMGLSG